MKETNITYINCEVRKIIVNKFDILKVCRNTIVIPLNGHVFMYSVMKNELLKIEIFKFNAEQNKLVFI